MKKCSLFAILILVFSLENKAQYFGLDFDSKKFYTTALNFPQDNNYRVLVTDLSYPIRPQIAPFIKIFNASHQLIGTKTFFRGIQLPVENPLKVGNRLLLPCSYWDTTSVSNPVFKISVLELDTFYNVIALHHIGGYADSISEVQYEPTGIVAYSNGYIMGGTIWDLTSPNYRRTRLYKLDKLFNTLDSSDFYSFIYIQNAFAFNNRIVATTSRLASPCVLTALSQKLVIDTNLNIINCKVLDSLFHYQCFNLGVTFNKTIGMEMGGKAVALSATKTFIFGEDYASCSYWGPSGYDNIVNSILDFNNVVLKTNLITNTLINNNYPIPWGASPFAVSLPFICTLGSVGYTNVPSYPPPFYPYFYNHNLAMVVNKTDTMGNVIWVKRFGGEINTYGRSITFTSDGGCLIAGTRYDSATMYSQHISQNFLLKLDPNGNYNSVGIYENGLLNSHAIRCFPNPANKQLFIDVPFDSKINIKFFNALGEEMFQINDYENLSPINVGTLKRDLYFFKVSTKVGNYSGKFLKE